MACNLSSMLSNLKLNHKIHYTYALYCAFTLLTDNAELDFFLANTAILQMKFRKLELKRIAFRNVLVCQRQFACLLGY